MVNELILWSDLPVGGVAVDPADNAFLLRLERGFMWLRNEDDPDRGFWPEREFDFDLPPLVHVIATNARAEWDARRIIAEYRQAAADRPPLTPPPPMRGRRGYLSPRP